MTSVFFSQADFDAWIAEDAGFLNLTTQLLQVNTPHAHMDFELRHHGMAAGTDAAAMVLQRCGAQPLWQATNGQTVTPGSILLQAEGPAGALLRGWKVAQNLLEYACGVATVTARMVSAVHRVAPKVAILTTRKHPPRPAQTGAGGHAGGRRLAAPAGRGRNHPGLPPAPRSAGRMGGVA